jgi:16S rRNA (cytosine967-C5)-methyltransferase
MHVPFREHHLLAIFNSYEIQAGPLDLFLRNYFRANKAVGAKDRKAIADAVYGIIRWRGLLDNLIGKPLTWKRRYDCFQKFSPEKHLSDANIPLHIRLSFPKNLFTILKENLGEDKVLEFCLACNASAPTTVRVNTLQTSREFLLSKWEKEHSVTACALSATGITFHKKINFFALPEFKQGFFEVQDEASQLIADLVQAAPGDHVLDFCAGSGGKSLAIAPKMENKGQLYLHDIRPLALQEAKKRLKRAGIQNAQLLFCDSPNKTALKNTMDWVLVDAPCSGMGTLRRNPDMKWKFDENALNRLIEEQRIIFEEALSFVKPGGKIVYATCSVLPIENIIQAEFFERHFKLERIADPFSSFPQKGGMDGFFGIVFTKK